LKVADRFITVQTPTKQRQNHVSTQRYKSIYEQRTSQAQKLLKTGHGGVIANVKAPTKCLFCQMTDHRNTAKSCPKKSSYGRIVPPVDITVSVNAATRNTNPDILTFNQAMASNDLWIVEISELEDHGCWKEVPRSSGTGKVVPCQWIFRIKQSPDGSITKFKARIVLRGDLMEDIYDVTSPVVAFSTVCLFLILSLQLGWYSCSVDFSNAFIQASRPDQVFKAHHIFVSNWKPQRICLSRSSFFTSAATTCSTCCFINRTDRYR